MLKEIVGDNGKSYLKYVPSDEELINMFIEWKKLSMIKPRDYYCIVKDNLEKYDKIELYEPLKEKLKKMK